MGIVKPAILTRGLRAAEDLAALIHVATGNDWRQMVSVWPAQTIRDDKVLVPLPAQQTPAALSRRLMRGVCAFVAQHSKEGKAIPRPPHSYHHHHQHLGELVVQMIVKRMKF